VNVLITGGTGFIGSHVAREFVLSGHNVTLFDLQPETLLVKDLLKQVTVIRGDIRNLNEIIQSCKQYEIDSIIHLAYMFTRPSQQNPMLATNVNILGTMNIFEALRLLDLKRVVWASSNSVYGRPLVPRNRKVFDENDPVRPSTVYGACKAYNEFMAESYCREFGVSIVGLRICAVPFGLGMSRRKDSAVSFLFDLFDNGIRGERCVVSAAELVMQWQYVKDLAVLFKKACIQDKVRHTLFNTGGENASMRKIAAIVQELTGAKIEYSSEIPEFADEVFDIDYSLIKEEFAYAPAYDIRRGLDDFVNMVLQWERQL